MINDKSHQAHRLAWIYMTGHSPKNQIDHIDGVRFNNAWVNLREATNKQNQENRALSLTNVSGYRGVCWKKSLQKWSARVGHHGKRLHIGYFDTPEEAGKAAAAKRAELFTHYTGRDQVNTFA
jgi:hypothetical protein